MNKNATAATQFLQSTRPIPDATAKKTVEAEVAKALKPSYRKSFFERQTENSLNKDQHHTDLAYRASLGEGSGTNKNLGPAKQTLAEMGSPTDKLPKGEKARCKAHCTKPGRTTCQHCHGRGYDAVTSDTEKAHKANQARHILGAPRGNTAPASPAA